MASKKEFLSPGIFITERDLTFSTENVGVTTLGLTGETLKGPAFQPFLVNNYDEFKTIFGGQNPKKFRNTQIPKYELPYIARSYLSQSNQLFVTRILGLSGYDKGKAYVLKTVGRCDSNSLSATTTGETTVDFYVDDNGNFRNLPNSGPTDPPSNDNLLIDVIKKTLDSQISFSNGVTFTTEDFDGEFNNFFTEGGSSPFDNEHDLQILKWGDLQSNHTTYLESQHSATTFINAYELPSDVSENEETDHWLKHFFRFNESTNKFHGQSFAIYTDLNSLGTLSVGHNNLSGATSGTVNVFYVEYEGTPFSDFHNKLIATLRSRASYVGDKQIFNIRESSGGTVSLSDTSNIINDVFSNFKISGITETGGNEFEYTVSLDPDKRSYAKNVLGDKAFDRDTELYVEEIYTEYLEWGKNRNKFKGINTSLQQVDDWNHFKFQFQTPETPYIVSEIQGNNPKKLFKLINISDGHDANYEIKVSFANIDLAKKAFDVYVRAFSDSDKNPVILERFVNCNMNPNSDNFIGRKIGTIDSQYELVSSYVMLELVDGAPTNAVPAGFEGYPFRTHNAKVIEPPKIPYKTKYYAAGDVIYTPLNGSKVVSGGDKFRKNYLGFSDRVGIENDLFPFKGFKDENGNSFNATTKGFHLDANADTAKFEVGESGFTDPISIESNSDHPYHDIRSRKFTTCMYGGFDGWDMFRDWRTNTDDYIIGGTGFKKGNFDTFIHSEFKELWGNSDYYAYLYGIKTFADPEVIDINVLATPGIDVINHTSLVQETIEMVEEERGDAIYITTLPDIKLLNNTDPSDSANWLYPDDVVSQFNSLDLDSNYTATYYPWIQKKDEQNNTNIFIPPTTEVIRNLAFTDNTAQPWYAFAGYNRGLVNAIRTREIKIGEETRNTLYQNQINPIATFSDVGPVIWGNKNLQQDNTILNRINIRRLLLHAQKLITNVGRRLLFDPNDEPVENDFLSQVNPILDRIRKERGLFDFRVALDEDTEDLDRNTLRGRIYLKPTPTLEFIDLTFVVTPASASFNNV